MDTKVQANDFEGCCCFFCLQQVTPIYEEQPLNFLFNYLKVEKLKSFVCEKCGEILRQFINAWKGLEKARLEMDYFLGCIQSTILNSNDSGMAAELNCVRESVRKSCQERIWKRKPQIILERADLVNIKKGDRPELDPDCPDWFSNWDDGSKLSDSERECKSSTEIGNVTLEELAVIGNRKRRHINLTTKVKCQNCPKLFNNKMYLKRHNDAVHLRLRPFKCSTCPASFSANKNLQAHVDAVHLKLKPFMCDLCGKSFATFQKLQRHRASPHHPHQMETASAKAFPCKLCEKSFGNQTSLKIHSRSVHSDKRFPCLICGKIFKRNHALKRHLITHDGHHSCQVGGCDMTYSKVSELQAHYKSSHPDFTLPRRESRKDFYTKTTENGFDIFTCKICGRQCDNQVLIVHHVKMTHGPKTFICEICGYKTPSKDFLERHIDRMHNTSDPVECKICKKQFNSERIVKFHMQNVHVERKFKCPFCQYAARLKSNLDAHVRNVHKKTANQ